MILLVLRWPYHAGLGWKKMSIWEMTLNGEVSQLGLGSWGVYVVPFLSYLCFVGGI